MKSYSFKFKIFSIWSDEEKTWVSSARWGNAQFDHLGCQGENPFAATREMLLALSDIYDQKSDDWNKDTAKKEAK